MSIYKEYSSLELESHFSNFLIDSWSFSRLSQFARNEKEFEKIYLYGERGKRSATSIAGNAYHYSVEQYFKNGRTLDIVDLEKLAINYIEAITPNQFKLQKTTPTVDECIKKSMKIATSALSNFFYEKSMLEDEIEQVLDVEIGGTEWLTINGVDIPLPCQFMIDLVVLTKSGKVVVVDHKTRLSFSDESEIILSNGNQAITYALGYKSLTGLYVDEVWFIENKVSVNKDKTPQLRKHKFPLDNDTMKLYEYQLYEPLKRMIEAVNNPDYIYINNPSDSYSDKAELFDFWAKTMISEVEDFNVNPSKRNMISKRLRKIKDSSISMINPKVISTFKNNASSFIQYDLSNKNMSQEEKLEHILKTFGIVSRVAHKFVGYSSTTFLLEVSAGTKISSILSHKLDIANALDVANVRMGKELTVYEDKSFLSVEFSSASSGILHFDKTEVKSGLIPLGKDNLQNTIYWNLNNHSTPHMLICGATGSGKSVCIKTIVESAKSAGVDRVVIFDPKYEFLSYRRKGYEVYNEITEIEEEISSLVNHMQDLVKTQSQERVLVIFDEFADAIANSRKGKDLDLKEMVIVGHYANGIEKTKFQKIGELKSLEENLRILAQKGRSVGFRIVTATQRASVKVITGDAKVNFPVQICFRVPKETDSRVVIDEAGAESLNGAGDGLIKSPEFNEVVRFQAFYT